MIEYLFFKCSLIGKYTNHYGIVYENKEIESDSLRGLYDQIDKLDAYQKTPITLKNGIYSCTVMIHDIAK